ncbi:hypothetical protein LTR95_008495 [Oleoguttula sp. CCFEE 5521]
MEGQMSVGRYRHEELPDAATHIRFLEILQAPQDGLIQCKLTTWLFANAPPYTAISYTWGDPADTTVIIVNSTRMTVRENCAYALRQASWYGVGYLWVDAICIDQSNDKEKGCQVQIMGDIYRDAKNALTCVGRTADDSIFLCQFLAEHQSTLSYFADQGAAFGSGIIGVVALSGLLAFSQHDDTGRDSDLPRAVRESVPWSRTAQLRRVCAASADTCNLGDLDVKNLAIRSTIILVRRKNKETRGLRRLDLVFVSMSDLKCADPRDKIYALLSIIEPSLAQQIVVDYSEACFEVATNFMSVLLGQSLGDDRSQWFADFAPFYMSTLSDAIRIPSSDQCYLAAISARRRSSRGRLSTIEARFGETRPRLRPFGCKGVRIDQRLFYAFSGRKMDEPLADSGSTVLRIEDAVAGVSAIVPGSTRPGDWIVRMLASRQDQLAVVLREAPDGSFEITSTAITRGYFSETQPTARFTAHFDLEDFATIFYLHASFFADSRPALQLQISLQEANAVISEPPPSNEGYDSWPSPFESRSEQDFEHYFSVGICHQPGSSYAQLESVLSEKR